MLVLGARPAPSLLHGLRHWPLLRYGTALALEPDKHGHQAVKVQTAGRGKGDGSEVQLRPRDPEAGGTRSSGLPRGGEAAFPLIKETEL